MRKIVLASVLTLLFLYPLYAFDDISQIGVGARSLGLGRAQLAAAGDASSVFINPASLAEIKKASFTSMSGTLIQDVNYTVFGLANPFDFGTIGFGYVGASVPDIPLTVMAGATPESVGQTSYGSSVLALAYAKEINAHLSIGGGFKYFNQGLSLTSASLEGASGSGWGVDLGAKFRANPWFSLGFNVQNVLSTRFSWQKNSVSETIPMLIKAGLECNLVGKEGLYVWPEQKLYLNFDLDYPIGQTRPLLMHVGLEWWPVHLLALRTGIDQSYKAGNGRFGTENNFSAGVGIYLKGFTFDYAYHNYGGILDNTTHYFSIGFLGRKAGGVGEKIEQVKRNPYLSPVVKGKPRLDMLEDVADDFWAHDAIVYVSTLGIMRGYPDGTFWPDKPIDRAEMAAILVKAKQFDLSKIAVRQLFVDLPADHWAAPYVQVAVDRGYLSGYPDGMFRPYQKLRRDEAMVILAKFAGLIEPKRIYRDPYPDLPRDHWAAKWITAAKQAGLLEYLEGRNFSPDEEFTRAEAAEILSKTKFGKTKIRRFLQNI